MVLKLFHNFLWWRIYYGQFFRSCLYFLPKSTHKWYAKKVFFYLWYCRSNDIHVSLILPVLEGRSCIVERRGVAFGPVHLQTKVTFLSATILFLGGKCFLYAFTTHQSLVILKHKSRSMYYKYVCITVWLKMEQQWSKFLWKKIDWEFIQKNLSFFIK